MKNITILLVMLLFTVLQSVCAQAELDTLQTELNEITKELKELRKQKTVIIRDQNAVQSAEKSATDLSLGTTILIPVFDLMVDVLPKSGREYEERDRQISRIDLSRRTGNLYILKSELQRQGAEITRQMETLQIREAEIKKQLKTSQSSDD